MSVVMVTSAGVCINLNAHPTKKIAEGILVSCHMVTNPHFCANFTVLWLGTYGLLQQLTLDLSLNSANSVFMTTIRLYKLTLSLES